MPAPPIFIPIIIPQPPRDCITVEGKLYCRDEEIPAKDIGIILIIFLIAVLYIIAVIHLATEVYDNGYIMLAGIFAPLLILALYLIFK